MKQFDPTHLSYFIGTSAYYLIANRVVLTDGTKYVAEHANAFWLMDAIASYLPRLEREHSFVVAVLTVSGSTAKLSLTDGNHLLLAEQEIEYTDFPAKRIMIYACLSTNYWVLMLPSEY